MSVGLFSEQAFLQQQVPEAELGNRLEQKPKCGVKGLCSADHQAVSCTLTAIRTQPSPVSVIVLYTIKTEVLLCIYNCAAGLV